MYLYLYKLICGILLYFSSAIERPHVFRMPRCLFYEMPNFAILFFTNYSQNRKIREFIARENAPYGIHSMVITEGEDVEFWDKVHAKTMPSFLGFANNKHWMRYFQLATKSYGDGERRKIYFYSLNTKTATK